MHASEPQALVVLCTAPASDDHAARLARGLVDARLAACVNVVPNVRSYYRWQGAVQVDDEVQLVIKTAPARLSAVQAYLAQHHPYDVPEVLALPVSGGSPSYLAWLVEQTTSPA